MALSITAKLPSIPYISKLILITCIAASSFLFSFTLHFDVDANPLKRSVYDSHDDTNDRTPSHKIAFLFITVDNLRMPSIWNEFFSKHPKGNKYYNIYVHSKYADNITAARQQYLIQNVLPPRLIVKDAQRFSMALVHATNALFEYAYNDDPLNKKFIVLSESHVPLYNLSTIYSKLMKNNNSKSYVGAFRHHPAQRRRFNLIKTHYMKQHGNKSEKFVNEFVDLDHFFMSGHWIVLDRYFIEKYLLRYKFVWSTFFENFTNVAEEHYYCTMIEKYVTNETEKNEFLIPDILTHVKWPSRNSSQWNGKGHPWTFFNLTNDLIDTVRNQKKLFLRKVSDKTVIESMYHLLH